MARGPPGSAARWSRPVHLTPPVGHRRRLTTRAPPRACPAPRRRGEIPAWRAILQPAAVLWCLAAVYGLRRPTRIQAVEFARHVAQDVIDQSANRTQRVILRPALLCRHIAEHRIGLAVVSSHARHALPLYARGGHDARCAGSAFQFQICHPGRTQGRWESPFKVYEPSTETRCEGESFDFPKNKWSQANETAYNPATHGRKRDCTGRTSTKKLQWLSGKRAPDSRHAVGNDRASRGRQVMMRYLLVQPYGRNPGDDR